MGMHNQYTYKNLYRNNYCNNLACTAKKKQVQKKNYYQCAA